MVDESPADLQLFCKNVTDLNRISESILDFAGDIKIWLFYGEMGSGKTTLIQSICSLFKVMDNVNSPTFSLVNEYLDQNGEVVYHFDFYRVENYQEALDIGCEEYFDSNSYCFIEWPEIIDHIVPPNHLKIKIIAQEKDQRKFEIRKYE